MIERKLLEQKMKEYHIKEFIATEFMKTGFSHTKIQRTPLGDKITIFTSRPGLVVGRKGENIKKLTNTLKSKFKMDNPQIEIGDIENPYFDAQSIAEKMAYTIEKFGPQRFKSIGYKTLQSIMDAGALGAEIVISGKIPSSRAKRWRFMDGYLKKCGYVSDNLVIRGRSTAHIRAGAVGISVNIMPPGITLPDDIKIIEQSPELKEVKEETTVNPSTVSQEKISTSNEVENKNTAVKNIEKKKMEKKDEKSGRAKKAE